MWKLLVETRDPARQPFPGNLPSRGLFEMWYRQLLQLLLSTDPSLTTWPQLPVQHNGREDKTSRNTGYYSHVDPIPISNTTHLVTV